jgi:hypothetical protein
MVFWLGVFWLGVFWLGVFWFLGGNLLSPQSITPL